MDTTLSAVAVAEEGAVTVYVRAADAEHVSVGDAVKVNDVTASVVSVSAQPVAVDDSFTDYMLHVGSLQAGEWVYEIALNAECADGVYAAQIVIDSVSPMSFVLN